MTGVQCGIHGRILRRALAASMAALFAGAGSAAAETGAPFRLTGAIGAPEWLTLGGSYRLRYETLDGRFRAAEAGSDQILVERLLLAARIRMGALYAGGELEDSRQQLADHGTHLGTDSVDAFEPLQFYLGYRARDVFAPGDELDLMTGRMTIDEGSRRLVARNRFRNTSNGFTGLRATWRGAGGVLVDAFFVLPVNRAPSDFASLVDNAVRLDAETSRTRFWGLFVAQPELIGRATGEIYLYGFHDEDRPQFHVADRDLYTPGMRLVAKPEAGRWDYELEAAMQFGTSRATRSPGDLRDLAHLAGFVHASLGYTWASPWSPRLSLDYDYASGDAHPGDGVDNRFDTLYGARSFDYGPTGIYGPFVRSNIDTPGLRIEFKPEKRLDVMVGYRLVWLASSRDSWTTAKLTDPSGAAGSYLGEQIEARLRYALSGNVELEAGGAFLARGTFQRSVAGAPDSPNTSYAYTAATLSF